MPRRPEGLPVRRAGGLGGRPLRLVEAGDQRTILRPPVGPLPHPLRRIVALPEDPEQPLVGDRRRVEDHEHHLGVPGAAGADLLVGGVRREAGGVARGGCMDPRLLPEAPLRPPEAAEAEERPRHPLRERRHDPRSRHEVALRHRHRLRAPRQRRLGRHHLAPVPRHPHRLSPAALTLPAGPPTLRKPAPARCQPLDQRPPERCQPFCRSPLPARCQPLCRPARARCQPLGQRPGRRRVRGGARLRARVPAGARERSCR
ncbi:MAG: hypothetical protein BWX64_02868 [Acidobacteria bacterium ADurb.Bin051]|nr:MAG: hypothetical protein BWX64_02868 [Acidobacteria bacterium ADurb.Bin051]